MNETTPLIGICGVSTTARWGIWNQPAVVTAQTSLDAVHRAGGQPLILPPLDGADTDLLLHTVDAVVVVGGTDWFELEIAAGALHERVPVLGIGRGLQMLSVAAGGTLHRHFEAQRPAATSAHTIDVAADSVLGEAGFAGVREVESHYHLGVATVGKGGRVTAVSLPDGRIEAVEWSGHPFAVGVQWQPEGPPMHNLFRALINAATAPLFDGSAYPVQP